MKIQKLNYSRGAWRLVDESGREVYAERRFKHPDLGWTSVNGPVCGDTKAECLERVLELLGLMAERLRRGHASAPIE